MANADYRAASTGPDAASAFLIDTGGQGTAGVVQRVRGLLGSGPTVTDIAQVRGRIGSSLISVDLAGPPAWSSASPWYWPRPPGGLVFGLGLGERRRTFAIAHALGANRSQLAASWSARPLR